MKIRSERMKSCTSLSQRGCNISFLLPVRFFWKWGIFVSQTVIIMACFSFVSLHLVLYFWISRVVSGIFKAPRLAKLPSVGLRISLSTICSNYVASAEKELTDRFPPSSMFETFCNYHPLPEEAQLGTEMDRKQGLHKFELPGCFFFVLHFFFQKWSHSVLCS